MKQKCAILIVRVSTEIQDYNSQVEDLKKFGQSQGYENFKIIESKESGLADLKNRKGINELFDLIQADNQYDTVIVTELSRLGRRQSVLQSIKEKLIENKIQLIVKDIGYKLFDDDERKEISFGGDAMFTLFSLFSENEVKTKKDRFIRKRKELMANGLSFFGGKVLFGYRLESQNGKNILVVEEQNANIVRMIFDWYLNGLDATHKNPSIQMISRECVKRGFHKYTHSKRNLTKLLHEEAYIGFKVTKNKYKNYLFDLKESQEKYINVSNEISYPQILSKEIFIEVQNKIKLKTSEKQTKHITLLSGLIECTSCGRKLSANYRFQRNSHSYRCTSRSDTFNCSSSAKSFSMALIDSIVWEIIKLDKVALLSKIKELDPSIQLVRIEKELEYSSLQLESKQREADKINELLLRLNMKNVDVTNVISTHLNRLDSLDKEMGKLKNELLRLESEKLNVLRESVNTQKILSERIDTIEKSKEKIRTYINQFIDSIHVRYSDTKYSVIEIKFKFFSDENKDSVKFEPKKDILGEKVTVFVDKSNTNRIQYIKRTATYSQINLGQISIIFKKYRESQKELKKLNHLY